MPILKNDNSLISVIIPVYHGETFILTAIRSVLNQTYKNVEIIISPDDGQNYLFIQKQFNDQRIKILEPLKNIKQGPGPTRNRAIKHSKGEFICTLDADDLITKNYIEKLLLVAKTYNSACAKTKYTNFKLTEEIRIIPINENKTLDIPTFSTSLGSIHPFYHRSLEPYYENVFAEDVLHDVLIIAQIGKIPIVDDEFYILRENDGSVTNTDITGENKVQQAYANIINKLQSNNSNYLYILPKHRQEIINLFMFRQNVSGLYSQSGMKTTYQRFAKQYLKNKTK